MSEAPPFWYKKPGIASWLLAPVGMVYGRVTAKRMATAPRYTSPLPVICVGNLVAGGAGKTPTVLALLKLTREMGLKPGVLSRGYGGSVTKPTAVDGENHNARDVGDEPLLLAQQAPTVVSVDRPAGARLLEELGVNIIIMDDGFQNPNLQKDFSFVLVDAYRGIGNGFCMPAGPLRANLRAQLSQASTLVLVGKGDNTTALVRQAARMAKPIVEASVTATNGAQFIDTKVLAYAGIADPGKFYRSLEEIGADIVIRRSFHDHHPFSDDECRELVQQAASEHLQLVTTRKDYMRLSRMGEESAKLAQASDVLDVELNFDNPLQIKGLFEKAIEDARVTRLK